jgi:hypothetical protein
VPCISTQIGDINFKTLTYQSKTTNNISLGMLESTKEATISKKPTVKSEQLVLNILDKKDDALRYSLGKDNMDLVLLCASDGVHAQILGNKLLILNSANVQKGDTWINSSSIIVAPFFILSPVINFACPIAEIIISAFFKISSLFSVFLVIVSISSPRA